MTNNNRTSRTRIADSEHDGRKPRSIGSLPSVPVEFTDTVGYLPILRATCYTRSLDSLSDMFRSIVLLWLCFLRVTRPEIIPVTAVLHSDPDQLLYVECTFRSSVTSFFFLACGIGCVSRRSRLFCIAMLTLNFVYLSSYSMVGSQDSNRFELSGVNHRGTPLWR